LVDIAVSGVVTCDVEGYEAPTSMTEEDRLAVIVTLRPVMEIAGSAETNDFYRRCNLPIVSALIVWNPTSSKPVTKAA
jgi:hypothetical protein